MYASPFLSDFRNWQRNMKLWQSWNNARNSKTTVSVTFTVAEGIKVYLRMSTLYSICQRRELFINYGWRTGLNLKYQFGRSITRFYTPMGRFIQNTVCEILFFDRKIKHFQGSKHNPFKLTCGYFHINCEQI